MNLRESWTACAEPDILTPQPEMLVMPGPLNIGLVCSHGGHLNEMQQLMPAFAGHRTFFFSYDAETTRRLPQAYLVPNMARNPLEFTKNLFRLWRIFRKERPDLMVSTGAEIALPAWLIAACFRVPCFYIECGAQVIHPSFTGRLMYWLADEFHVQWPELLAAYGKRAHFEGSLIDAAPGTDAPLPAALPRGEYIYVTVGTMFLDFARLLKKMDEIALKTGERVIIQTGLSKTPLEHAEHFDFKNHEETLELQRGARLIVCHAGIGALRDALESGCPFIVVPRRHCRGEHTNDHQLELAEAVKRRGWGRVVMEMDELEAACASPTPAPAAYRPAREGLLAAVRRMVDRISEKKNA